MLFKNKTHIIFDWDGTLADTLSMWASADTMLLSKYGKTPRLNAAQERDRFLHQNNTGDIYLKYNQYLIDTYDIKNVTAEKLNKERGDSIINKSKIIDLKPGAEEFLKRARQLGYTLTLATISAKRNINIYVNENEIIKRKTDGFKIFNGAVLTGDDVVHKKPNPEVYQKALSLSGKTALESIVIEDSITGVTAATTAGINTISIYDEHNDSDRERISVLVDYEARDFFELIKEL